MSIALIMNECPLGTESRGGTETYNTFLYGKLTEELGYDIVPIYRKDEPNFDPSKYDLVILSDWDLWVWSRISFDYDTTIVILHIDSHEHRRFIECFPSYHYVIQHEGGTEETLKFLNVKYDTIHGTSRLEGLQGCELRMELPEKFSIVVSSHIEEKGMLQSIRDIIRRDRVAVYVGCDEDRPTVKKARELGAIIYGRASKDELVTLMRRAEELVHLPIVWRESNPLVMIEGYSQGLKSVGNHLTPAYLIYAGNLTKDELKEWYATSKYSNQTWVSKWDRLIRSVLNKEKP